MKNKIKGNCRNIQSPGGDVFGEFFLKNIAGLRHLFSCGDEISFVCCRVLQSPVQSIRGKNLDFSRSTIPTVGRYEKCGVFGKHRTSHSTMGEI